MNNQYKPFEPTGTCGDCSYDPVDLTNCVYTVHPGCVDGANYNPADCGALDCEGPQVEPGCPPLNACVDEDFAEPTRPLHELVADVGNVAWKSLTAFGEGGPNPYLSGTGACFTNDEAYGAIKVCNPGGRIICRGGNWALYQTWIMIGWSGTADIFGVTDGLFVRIDGSGPGGRMRMIPYLEGSLVGIYDGTDRGGNAFLDFEMSVFGTDLTMIMTNSFAEEARVELVLPSAPTGDFVGFRLNPGSDPRHSMVSWSWCPG